MVKLWLHLLSRLKIILSELFIFYLNNALIITKRNYTFYFKISLLIKIEHVFTI